MYEMTVSRGFLCSVLAKICLRLGPLAGIPCSNYSANKKLILITTYNVRRESKFVCTLMEKSALKLGW